MELWLHFCVRVYGMGEFRFRLALALHFEHGVSGWHTVKWYHSSRVQEVDLSLSGICRIGPKVGSGMGIATM